MMKRLLMLSCLVSCLVVNGYCEQLSEMDAMQVANRFLNSNKGNSAHHASASNLNLAYKSKNITTGKEGAYYVFNRGVRDGYVVVAGDDAVARPVLGYSERGTFDAENIPENMRYWLDEYQRQIEYMQENKMESVPAQAQAQKWTTSVAPLLGEIKWGQGTPYNLMCPTLPNGNKAVAGCVATAMAQIMYYYNWPEVGMGSHSYTWEYLDVQTVLSADFSKSKYEWEKMSPVYNAESSAESQEAVAKLMSDVGVSVDMDYGPSSGAASAKACRALLNNFKYRAKLDYREMYLNDDWNNMIKKELDEGRPVYYSGHNSSHSGHAFVCDGYNEDGYFHINWGWNGNCDGYFLLYAMSPDMTDDGYTFSQTIIKGICPDEEGGEYKEDIIVQLDSWEIQVSEVLLGNKAKVYMEGMWNMTSDTLPLEFSLNLYKGDELVKKTTIVKREVTPPHMGLGASYVQPYFTPALEAGEYRLYPQYKLISEPDSAFRNMVTSAATPDYIKVEIIERMVYLSFPQAQYSLNLKVLEAGTIGINSKIYPLLTIENNGGTEYFGGIYMKVLDMSDKVLSTCHPKMLFVDKGETANIRFELDPVTTVGTYKLAVYDENGTQIGLKGVSVQDLGTANLAIVADITPKSKEMTLNDIEASVTIKNNGSYYVGNLEMMIYDDFIRCRLYSFVTINNGETKVVTFKGVFPEAEIGKEYDMAMRLYNRPEKNYIWGKSTKITIVAEKSAIDEVAEDDEAANEEYFTLQGVKVENPEKGIYIRKQGSKVTKVVL